MPGAFEDVSVVVTFKQRKDSSHCHNFAFAHKNIAVLTVYLIHGQVLFPLGIAAAISNMLGNYVGSSLVLTKDPKIVKPVIILVLALLLVKIVVGF